MTRIQYSKIVKFLTATTLILALTACGGSSGSNPLVPPPPPPPPPPPASVPQNVQVVSGDNNTDEIENTISWTLDPAATDYTVYWDNVAGVTANSSVVVPTVAGTRYVTHSGVAVTEGNSYYYRVQAE